MKTNFFSQLAEACGDSEVTMTFKNDKKGKYTFSVHTKNSDLKDGAQKFIPPIVGTDTVDNLDDHFFEAISSPMKKAVGLIDSMHQFETQLEKAESESKMAKEKAEKEKKAKEDKKKKFDSLIKKAKELEESKQYSKAIGCLREAIPFAEDPAKVEKDILAIKAKLSQGSLFGEQEPIEEKTDFLNELNTPVHKQEPETDLDDHEDDDNNGSGEE